MFASILDHSSYQFCTIIIIYQQTLSMHGWSSYHRTRHLQIGTPSLILILLPRPCERLQRARLEQRPHNKPRTLRQFKGQLLRSLKSFVLYLLYLFKDLNELKLWALWYAGLCAILHKWWLFRKESCKLWIRGLCVLWKGNTEIFLWWNSNSFVLLGSCWRLGGGLVGKGISKLSKNFHIIINKIFHNFIKKVIGSKSVHQLTHKNRNRKNQERKSWSEATIFASSHVKRFFKKIIGSNRIRQFTLMGVSAGAFGVAFNCDAVAAKVKAKDPNAGAFKTFVDVDVNIDVDKFKYNAAEAKVNSRILTQVPFFNLLMPYQNKS